jgi:hypothetical protein
MLRDGRLTSEWSLETNRESTGHLVVCCSCGWRGGRYRDFGLDAGGARWWPSEQSEVEEQAAHDDWWHRHMAPMVDSDPDRMLVLSRDSGGMRHYLAGRPVHAGTVLELRLVDDVWVRVRYEWSWDAAVPPRAHLALGSRGEALGYAPTSASFPLPEAAELRWPEAGARGLADREAVQ